MTQINSIYKNVGKQGRYIINLVYKMKKKETYVATRTHHFEQVFLEQTFHIVFLLSHSHCHDNLVCLAVSAE